MYCNTCIKCHSSGVFNGWLSLNCKVGTSPPSPLKGTIFLMTIHLFSCNSNVWRYCKVLHGSNKISAVFQPHVLLYMKSRALRQKWVVCYSLFTKALLFVQLSRSLLIPFQSPTVPFPLGKKIYHSCSVLKVTFWWLKYKMLPQSFLESLDTHLLLYVYLECYGSNTHTHTQLHHRLTVTL